MTGIGAWIWGGGANGAKIGFLSILMLFWLSTILKVYDSGFRFAQIRGIQRVDIYIHQK